MRVLQLIMIDGRLAVVLSRYCDCRWNCGSVQ